MYSFVVYLKSPAILQELELRSHHQMTKNYHFRGDRANNTQGGDI